jgi:cytochrome d ubiquinol oxidase subunit I
MRTADALTPGLSSHFAAATLALYVAVYGFIFCFGIYYILKIVNRGVMTGKVVAFWNGNAIHQTFNPDPRFAAQRKAAEITLAARKAASRR